MSLCDRYHQRLPLCLWWPTSLFLCQLIIIIIIIIITRNTFCRTRKKYVLSNSESVKCNFFHFWSRDIYPVQNLLLCTKFYENPMIFHWDMAIYWFSKWRPSAILELFYHHTRPTTKSLLLAAAACQISCQSDTQIWRYSYLNFSHIWLEMPIQAPKWEFRGTLDPKMWLFIIDTLKGTSLRKCASFMLSTIKIRWGVWPVGELTDSVTDTQTYTHTGTYIFCPCIALDRQ